MAAHVQSLDTNGNWVFIAPVGDLALTDAVHREFQIGRVLFVHAQKFRRIRKRLAIRRRVSEWPALLKKVIEDTPTIAVLRHSGQPRQLKAKCFPTVKEALYILSASQLHFAGRDRPPRPLLLDEGERGVVKHLFLNTRNALATAGSEVADRHRALIPDKAWKTRSEDFFFKKLLNILDGKTGVERSWRENLRRVAILVGESLRADDLPHAFLWNMIALEMLLTQRGDKYLDVLPERMEAFLGWAGFWQQRQFPERIRDAYKLRCKLVHDGDAQGVTKDQVEFTDCLLLNACVNLVNYPKLFTSKQHVIEFARKVAAEKVLGLKSRVRPKRLIMFPGK